MKFYLYQMYDERLGSWTFHQFMNATAEQMEYSIHSLCVKKPETIVEKQDCLLYIAGEVDVETGVVTLYEKRELVFDYRAAFKKAFPEEKEIEKVEEDGSKVSE